MSCISVIIVTLNRPDCVRRCLEHLSTQAPKPDQVIIVDASLNDETRQVVGNFASVQYLRNDNGYGRMTASRNIGLKAATGDIIAFLDDDAFAHPGWLAALVSAYDAPSVGAVGGRALNNQPGEELLGVNDIGRLKSNGDLTGHFAADPGSVIEVDHVMGCNMSFRREVVVQLGGFREDYPGISGIREDTDMSLRVKSLGHKIVFNPDACVDHVGAPQAKGKRFDLRYLYYSERNHLVMLIRNFGLGAGIVWRYVGFRASQSLGEFARKIAVSVARPLVTLYGTLSGLGAGIILLLRAGRDPIRHDAEAEVIKSALLREDLMSYSDSVEAGTGREQSVA